MKEIPMRDFDYITSPAKLLTPEIVQMVGSIHEHKGKFVKYYLGIMLKAYNEFESRVEHLKHRSLSKPDRIKAAIDNKVGKITKKEIMELCPDISKVTVERTLTDIAYDTYHFPEYMTDNR